MFLFLEVVIMTKPRPRERVSLRLPVELASWLRRRAAERHLTVSAVIENCVRETMSRERTELLLRAVLEGVAEILAQESGDPRKVKLLLLREAKGEMERARNEE